MARLDWHVTSEEGVTLVHLLVTSEGTERIRVENCLDGRVWPPRSQGVPEEGWADEGFEGVVDVDDRLVLGYASPADPTEPPARIESIEPVDGSESGKPVSARDVVRTLGDPTPPRDAVPRDGDADRGQPTETSPDCGRTDHECEGHPDHADHGRETGGHAAIDAWLDDVRERLDDAEGLARASSVPEASAAVDAVGGAGDVADLRSELEADREQLEELATESESLAARIERVEVPVETLKRLA
jgi:hypothetical protein